MAYEIVEVPASAEKVAELVGYLSTKYEEATTARSSQVESDYDRWINNYEAKPAQTRRNFPFPNASNLIIPLGQIHCDILEARLLGFMMAVRPFYTIRTWPPEGRYEWQSALSQWLDYKLNYVWMWLPQFRSILGRTLRGGTVTAKVTLNPRKYIIVRPGTGGERMVESEVTQNQLCLDPIPFRDFAPYPFTANSLRDVQIRFHTLRFTKEETERRVRETRWRKEEGDKFLAGPTESKTSTQTQIESSAGVEPRVTQQPFEAVEAHLEYPIANTGKYYDIWCTFDPKQKLCLQLIYNPNPRNLDSFVDFRLFPRDDCYYAYSLMQRLEAFQEESSAIHNDRRNSNLVSGVPGWKKKKYADTPNAATEWFPGKVFELENMDDLEILQFQKNYTDLISEEKQTEELADRVSGVSPPMQGFGAGVMQGKRGIYNAAGTLAMLQEGNRRVDIYLKHARDGFGHVGKLAYLLYRQAGVDKSEIANYPLLEAAFNATEPETDENLFFEITASSSSTNREADRTAFMMMSQILERYYVSIMQAAAQVAQLQVTAPKHPLIQLYLAILDGAHSVASHLLDAFDYSDKRRALPNAREILLGKSAEGGTPSGSGTAPGPESGGAPEAAGGTQGPDLSRMAEVLAGLATSGQQGTPDMEGAM
jgi:hypothetical protein